MRIIEYRGVPFVDREKEEKFLINRFKETPSRLLFIYGPKSSGKTTFLEYIVEEKLQKENKRFYVNYVNFRGYAIHNYDSFLNIYFYPFGKDTEGKLSKMKEKFKVVLGSLKGEVRIPAKGVNFAISIDLHEAIKNKEADPFELMLEIIRSINRKRKVIMIIDEVQELRDIYMNGELKNKYLLTEFFKFLVRLTKETHLAHIVVSTSSSIFIDEIYTNSKLAETSEFYLIDHFDYETTKEWLRIEGFKEEEINLIWEYFGGSPFRLNMVIEDKRMGNISDLDKYLEREANIIAGKIGLTVSEIDKEEVADYFLKMLNEILVNGYKIKEDKNKIEKKALNIGIEKDILFLRIDERKITFNSQILKKGAEVYLKNL